MKLRSFTKSFFEIYQKCPAHAALAIEHGSEKKLASEEQAKGIIFHYLMALEGCLELMDAMEIVGDEEVANWLAWTRNNYPTIEGALYEKRLSADREGNGNDWNSRFLAAVVDRVAIEKDVVIVSDWKTGRIKVHNEVEPILASYLAKACLYPKHKKFRFDYVYPRLELIDSHFIRYKTDRTVTVKHGENETEIKSRGQDPLLKFILESVEAIERGQPSPRPGPHCDNWFGTPCRFLGRECPLAEFIPNVCSWHDAQIRVTDGILDLPAEQAAGAAFMALLRNHPIEKTPELMALAFHGAQQLSGGTSKVMKDIRAWSKETGLNIDVGGERYGYRVEPHIDSEKALELLLAKADFSDVAKAVRISPSSLKRIGKRKYPGLVDLVKQVCTERVRVLFGKVEGNDHD